MYTFEENKLLSEIPQTILIATKGVDCYIAGGAITSVFCNRPINDYDFYFKTNEDLLKFLLELESTDAIIVNETDKALTIKCDGKIIQTVFLNYYKNPEEIFNDFDFTVCMGAYSFVGKRFYFHQDFFRHNSQRVLVFNPGNKFPIVSSLRVDKYKEKGYTISKNEFLKILFSITKEKFTSYEEVKKSIGGLYGVDIDSVFDNIEGEFSLEKVIDTLSNIKEFPTKNPGVDIDDYNEFCYKITGCKCKVFYTSVGLVDSDGDLIREGRDVEIVDPPKYVYKYVRKTNSGYESFYKPSFKYNIGEVVKDTSTGLHFVLLNNIDNIGYRNSANAVLLECEFYPDKVKFISSHEIILSEAKVIREYPKESVI